jgi:hypothetical protein
MNTYKGQITELNPKEVFIFGSNLQGFSGAGSAGYASFGKPGNIWREEGYADKPHGWRGRWAVKGCGEGFQMGTEGWSYALPTVAKAGEKMSRTPDEIKTSIKTLYAFALSKPTWKFFVAQSAKKGLNGYEPKEMARMFKCMKIPDNMYFEEEFAKLF